jgi:hypothetical protein
MKQLNQSELKEIQQAIFNKEISSAEVLAEIYDHYVSHLQGFPEEEFDSQLFELDQKFTYAHCHALQSKYNKTVREDISKTQWQVLRKYFCTSRWIYAAGILMALFYVANQTRSEKEIGMLLLSPLILLTLIWFVFNWRVAQKIRTIKRSFSGLKLSINSSASTPFSERIYLPVLLAQVLIYFPRLFDFGIDFNPVLPGIAAVITALLTLYMLSLLEVWKIKSKTALL